MYLWKKCLKNIMMFLGVVLWVGALSPEIFIQSGRSCILDENGEELTAEEAEEFMEAYFYGNSDKSTDDTIEIHYKIALLEFFN